MQFDLMASMMCVDYGNLEKRSKREKLCRIYGNCGFKKY